MLDSNPQLSGNSVQNSGNVINTAHAHISNKAQQSTPDVHSGGDGHLTLIQGLDLT